MKSAYIDNIPKASFDDQISQVAEKAAFDGGGSGMTVAVENEQQDVYRVFTTSGMGEYMHLCLGIENLDAGLKDIIKQGHASQYDTRFSIVND